MLRKMVVNGGVSKSSIICSTLSSLTNHKIERAKDIESSARGAAFLAGIAHKIFTLGNVELLVYSNSKKSFNIRFNR